MTMEAKGQKRQRMCLLGPPEAVSVVHILGQASGPQTVSL